MFQIFGTLYERYAKSLCSPWSPFWRSLSDSARTRLFSASSTPWSCTPLPFRDADRLVAIWEKNPALEGFIAERLPAALKNYNEWKRRAAVSKPWARFMTRPST